MQDSTVKDMFREEIVGKYIQISRSHEKSDEKIKELMSKDFSISDVALDELLNADNN